VKQYWQYRGLKSVFIIFFLLLASNWAWAQLEGKPFVRNYPPRLYKAAIQNWSIGQDKRGVMYFANDQGVLEYDGRNWRLIRTRNNSPVRSLSVDKNGTVFVGGSGEIGYLSPNEIGEMHFISLKDHLPKDAPIFEDVYTTHATNEGVYFHNDKFIFLYNLQTQKSQIWYSNPDSFFFLTFWVRDRLYVHDLDKGLLALQKGKIQPVRGGAQFKGERIYTILPYSSSKLLIGTRKKGLFLYNPNAIEDRDVIIPFDTDGDEFLLKNQLYNAILMPNGEYVFCTREGGALVMNRQGKIRSILDESVGLSDHNVRAAFVSQEGILWLAMDNGISQVNLQSPIRFWDASLGLKGTIRAISEFEGHIYVATSLGVYFLENGRFKEVSDIATECWTLLEYQPNDNQAAQLLVGTNDGIYAISKEQALLVKQTRPLAVLSLNASTTRKNYIFAGLKGGFLVLRYQNNDWTQVNTNTDIKDEIYSIAEDKQGNIWLGTFIQGMVKLNLDKNNNPSQIQRYDTRAGLPSERDNKVFFWNNRLWFGTTKGLYRFDNQANKFFSDNIFGDRFTDGSHSVYRFAPDNLQNIWISEVNNQRNPIGLLFRQKNRSYDWDDNLLRRLPEFSEPYIFPANDGLVWIGGSEDLFVVDAARPRNSIKPFYTLIRQVKLNEDSIVFAGTNFTRSKIANHIYYQVGFDQPHKLKKTFAYDTRFSLDFQCVATYFDNESVNEFSYALVEGVGITPTPADWSSWTKDSKKQYNNLREGDYTFYVKSRNVYGEEGQIAKFEFKIAPPYYRTILARVIYALLGVAFVIFLIYLNSQRLLRQQVKLQKLVAERTHQLSEKNAELETKNQEIMIQATKLQVAYEEISKKTAEIERKNRDITDSINYASRIQGAMFPSVEKMQRVFPESFVIYKPRDIVSGDFYWLAETPLEPRFNKDPNIKNGTISVFKGFAEGKKIIAAVDCTGHGIPAALVSMIGDSYLNQIINFEGVKQAHLILHELDFYIRHTLNQEETDSMDGMDMTICIIDPNNSTMEFAGAKNPIIYIQDEAISVIRGDKYGIGGFALDNSEKVFTRHIIPIDVPTCFYLFSDGYEDQFGGPKGKKFMIKKMKEMFLANHHKPMREQKQIYEQLITDWMTGYEQVDDILLLGVHLDPKDFAGN
jgi:serine phosphatase RsbU (regulator of sigma subunit)/ligand-binding sensor domain-containing protein